jgi:hypothetical protein
MESALIKSIDEAVTRSSRLEADDVTTLSSISSKAFSAAMFGIQDYIGRCPADPGKLAGIIDEIVLAAVQKLGNDWLAKGATREHAVAGIKACQNQLADKVSSAVVLNFKAVYDKKRASQSNPYIPGSFSIDPRLPEVAGMVEQAKAGQIEFAEPAQMHYPAPKTKGRGK